MKEFIKAFFSNKGGMVGLSVLISRAASFLITFSAARLLVPEEFGVMAVALNFMGFFSSLVGAGNFNGVLRYGTMLKSKADRERLYKYSFYAGLRLQLVLSVIIFVLAVIIYGGRHALVLILAVLLVRLLGTYFIEHRIAELRANFDNSGFARLQIVYALTGLASAVALLYFFGMTGFLISLCVAPFVVLLFNKGKTNPRDGRPEINLKEFWRFSFTMAAAAQIAEWLFLLDVFFIGLLLSDNDVAQYRVASIIPFNLVAIGHILLQTEYPRLCANSRSKKYQMKFLKGYLLTSFVIGLSIIIFGNLFRTNILGLFGPEYRETTLLSILLLSTFASLVLRIPFTYLISAIGKAGNNLIIAVIVNLLFSVGLYYCLPIYGLFGAAWLNVAALFLSGILSVGAYYRELKYI